MLQLRGLSGSCHAYCRLRLLSCQKECDESRGTHLYSPDWSATISATRSGGTTPAQITRNGEWRENEQTSPDSTGNTTDSSN